ncbi:MAG TPA: redox-sensing transcriptional repressor Rex [Clostridiales bacterium]|jgi:redox-sensing transcriptional repressor|nr:redox-sensing transcriptional repressor Rex [Clostridiales bacterium]
MGDKTLSKELIARLPRYFRYLDDYMNVGIKKVSSGELSHKMNVTASQIRHDLGHFTVSGQQGYGYNVKELYEEIKRVLGLNDEKKVIIVGAGNIGKALISHRMFRNRGFKLIGVFDIAEMAEISGHRVYPISKLPEFVQEYKPDIAILSVPSQEASIVAKELISLGIKALLNFCYVDLDVPDDVIVENVHLRDNLMVLAYKYDNLIKKKKK